MGKRLKELLFTLGLICLIGVFACGIKTTLMSLAVVLIGGFIIATALLTIAYPVIFGFAWSMLGIREAWKEINPYIYAKMAVHIVLLGNYE